MSVINLLLGSLKMDLEFWDISMTSLAKLSIIFKKYKAFLKNIIFGFSAGKDYEIIDGSKYFYDYKNGIGFLQSVYVDNAILKKYILPSSTIIDIGANIGQFNFFCKHYLKAKKVFSFEPIPRTYKLLELNSQSNNVYNCAISQEEQLTFYIPETSLMASSIKTDSMLSEEIVKTCDLDKLEELKEISNFDLLKIDTEGSELKVLKASKEIAKRSKYLLIETSVARESSGDILDLVKYLKEIIPSVNLIHIGRSYMDDFDLIAVDLLFSNTTVLSTDVIETG